MRCHDAIDRNDFARPNEQSVADGNLADRHVRNDVPGTTMRHPRGALDQRAQIVLGAGDGNLLEHIAAGIHQCHDGTGEGLAEHERGCHRQESDGIHAQAASQEVPYHCNCERRYDRDGRKRPADTREIGLASGMRDNARCQSHDRDRDQRPSQHALGHRAPSSCKLGNALQR